jgi:hypothetical protein
MHHGSFHNIVFRHAELGQKVGNSRSYVFFPEVGSRTLSTNVPHKETSLLTRVIPGMNLIEICPESGHGQPVCFSHCSQSKIPLPNV